MKRAFQVGSVARLFLLGFGTFLFVADFFGKIAGDGKGALNFVLIGLPVAADDDLVVFDFRQTVLILDEVDKPLGRGEFIVVELDRRALRPAVEFGDTVFFKEERSGLYINEMGRYYGHLTVNPKRAGDFFQWVLFNPEGEQFRGPLFVNSAFAMRSNRQNFELYVRVLSHVGNARIDTTDFKPDYRKARFRAYKMHLDHEGGFKSLCPSDADGNVCSNHGQCANKYCACNENYEGERCEHELVDAKCFVVADPHVTSFDGARYNLFGAGEYLLWQEYRDSEREAVSAFFGGHYGEALELRGLAQHMVESMTAGDQVDEAMELVFDAKGRPADYLRLNPKIESVKLDETDPAVLKKMVDQCRADLVASNAEARFRALVASELGKR